MAGKSLAVEMAGAQRVEVEKRSYRRRVLRVLGCPTWALTRACPAGILDWAYANRRLDCDRACLSLRE